MRQQDIELIKLLIHQEAAQMLNRVIERVYTYNAERREDPDFDGKEIHFRTLELLHRYTREECNSEIAWIERHEMELKTGLRL